MKARYESFGGIISLEKPPSLVYANQELMKKLGFRGSLVWEEKTRFLTAPTEVHFSITNECPMKCRHCYIAADKRLENELSTDELKEGIDTLSKAGVFHIAFGGGEPFARKDFLEIAEHARSKGIIPNVTTNGYYINEEIAKRCKIFGQIHVSIDGVAKIYEETRGVDGFQIANNAINLLVRCGNKVGINCVISKKNINSLGDIMKYAKQNKVSNVLFLRYKPSGRAKKHYEQMRLNNEQYKSLYRLFLKLLFRYRLQIYADCSFIPMICYQNPPKKLLEFFLMYGCVAGDILAGTLPDGRINGCSFCSDGVGSITDFKELWESSNHFKKFRSWEARAEEPCKSCNYLNICRGGCHVVAEHLSNDFFSPDPECPRVVEYENHNISAPEVSVGG